MTTRFDTIRREIDRVGWPGVAGIALSVFAAAFAVSAVVPVAAERDALRDQVRRLGERLRVDDGRAGRTDAAAALASFYDSFPGRTSSPEWLGRIQAAAEARGLELQSAEYRYERRPDARLARYEIVLPVTGSYPQIRGFVREVLAQVPAAALEELSLRREAVASPRLEARIRLALYLGDR